MNDDNICYQLSLDHFVHFWRLGEWTPQVDFQVILFWSLSSLLWNITCCTFVTSNNNNKKHFPLGIVHTIFFVWGLFANLTITGWMYHKMGTFDHIDRQEHGWRKLMLKKMEEVLTNLLSHCDQLWGIELGNNTLQHLRQENQEKPSINSTSGWNNSPIWKNAAIHYVRGRCLSKGCSFSTNACPGAKWDESGKFSSHTHKRDKHFVPRVIQIKMKMQSLFPIINLHMHTTHFAKFKVQPHFCWSKWAIRIAILTSFMIDGNTLSS